MGWRKMSNDDFHEAAVRGCESLHRQGKLTDEEMADQRRAWWARGGHLDGDDETVTWTVGD